MTAEHTLLKNIVDYAGLYPPAGLPLPEVLRNYASYQHLDTAWMLGRLVMNASQVPAFLSLRGCLPEAQWPLSVLVGGPEDWEVLTALGRQQRSCIRSLELKASSPQDIDTQGGLASRLGLSELYFEVPLDRPDLLEVLQGRELYAKARTGGITPAAFPAAEQVLRFIQQCVGLGLPFKMTAGLHHPLRGQYRLTYLPDSEQGTMHGYLNMLLATALVVRGLPSLALSALLETDPLAVQFAGGGVKYAGTTLFEADLVRTRSFLHSFGSCSFTEPSHERIPFFFERNP